MSKVVICGIRNSGKTCYFYGMLRSMMIGKMGFSIAPPPASFNSLRLAVKRMADTELPLEERLPAPSDKMEEYDLEMFYRMKKLDDLKWVDYPGEFLETASDEFLRHLDDSNALLICVDGEALQGEEFDIPNIVYSLQHDRGGLELNHALMQAQSRKQADDSSLPPVCIMITKYDKVSESLRNKEILEDQIIKQLFPALFDSEDAIVAICPVSLGKEIELPGGRLAPVNVEKPVLFSTYWEMRKNYVQMAVVLMAMNQKLNEYTTASQAFANKGILGKIITPKPTEPFTKEVYEKAEATLRKFKDDCNAMLESIANISLYKGGEAVDWETYRLE